MTNRERQIRDQVARALQRWPYEPSVQLACDRVVNALEDRPSVFWAPGACLEWSAGDATLKQRGLHRILCTGWEERLAAALQSLAAALVEVDDEQGSDTALALSDESHTALEQSSEIPPSWGDVWATTPGWLKGLVALWVAAELARRLR